LAVKHLFLQSWEVTDVDIDVAQHVPIVEDAVAHAEHTPVTAEPRQPPAQAHCGTEVVVIGIVDLSVRPVRRPSHQFVPGERTVEPARLEQVGVTGTREPEQASRTADGNSRLAVGFEGYTIVLVTHPQIQAEPAGDLPIVFEEEAVLALPVCT